MDNFNLKKGELIKLPFNRMGIVTKVNKKTIWVKESYRINGKLKKSSGIVDKTTINVCNKDKITEKEIRKYKLNKIFNNKIELI